MKGLRNEGTRGQSRSRRNKRENEKMKQMKLRSVEFMISPELQIGQFLDFCSYKFVQINRQTDEQKKNEAGIWQFIER